MPANLSHDLAAVTIETTVEADSLWSLRCHLAGGTPQAIYVDIEKYGTYQALENTLVAIRAAFEQGQINHHTSLYFRDGSGEEHEIDRDTITHLIGSRANLMNYLTQHHYTLGRAA